MDTSMGLPVSQLDPIKNNVWSGAGSVFTPYLGPEPQLGRVNPYEQKNNNFWVLTENYKDKNLYVRDTIRDASFTDASQSYIYGEFLPPYPTNDVNIQWSEFEARAHLMDLTPYTTRSHQIQQARSVRQAQLHQWGIEVVFDSQFLKTALGRVSYLAAIRQIANSERETIHLKGLQALVNCHRHQNQFLKETTQLGTNEFKRFLETDRERFAIVQKTKNGLEKLDLLISKEMQAYDGFADGYLIPEEVAIHATIVPAEKTDYYLAGQPGVDRVNGLPGNRLTFSGGTQGTLERAEPMHMVRQHPAFLVKNKMIQGATETEVQALTRIRQIGEYCTMLDECHNYDEYRTEHRSILMYDQSIDDFRKITLEQAIENCGIWAGDDVAPVAFNVKDNAATKADKDEDFLTVIRDDKTRGVVRFIADLNPSHLKPKHVICGGKTLLNSVLRGLNVDKITSRDAATGVVLINKGAIASLTTKIKTIIPGIKETLVTSVLNLATTAGSDYNTITTVTDNDATPAVFEYTGSELNSAFLELLSNQAPAAKRAEITGIANDVNRDVMDRATEIKNKLKEYVASKVPGMRMKEEAHVDKWFESRVAQYEQQFNEAKRQYNKSQRSSGQEGQIVGFAPKGMDLTGTGYTWMQEQEAVSNTGYTGVGMMMENRNKDFDGNPLTSTRFAKHRNAVLDMAENVEHKFASLIYLAAPFKKSVMLKFCENDVMVPINFLLFRPHMQYATRAIIKAARGGRSGYTFIGNDDLQIGVAAGRQMSMMKYTVHFRCVVLEPRNVYVQPDVYVQEALGGAGCRFWDVKSYQAYNPELLEHSLFAIAVPFTDTNFPSPMCATGRWQTEYSMGINDRGAMQRLQYSTAARYCSHIMYNWSKMARHGVDVPPMMRGYGHRNLVMYQGHQQNFNPKRGDHSKITPNKGHWTKNVYAGGCAAIRNGTLDILEPQDYSTRNSN